MTSRQDLISAIITAGATRCYAKINKEYRKTCDWDEEGSDNPEPISISLFIEGGNPVDVAKALWLHRPIGVDMNGDFSVYVEDTMIRWYNLDYLDYTEQKAAETKVARKLRKEYLKKELEELEKEDE